MSLDIHALSVQLGHHCVLQDITACCPHGKVTVLLGPNGAGKTTLLRAIAGLLAPSAGEIRIDGTAMSQLDPRTRARTIGYLPQAGDVQWDIDTRTLVGLGRLPHHGWRGGESTADISAIDTAMQDADVSALAHRAVRSLSGGERARVLLARVLAGTPRWLLADEPLANLDPAHQFDVLEIFQRSAARGCGVIIVLHDLAMAAHYADHVLLIKNGALVAAGAPHDVLTAQHIAALFGVHADVTHSTDGRPDIRIAGPAARDLTPM